MLWNNILLQNENYYLFRFINFDGLVHQIWTNELSSYINQDFLLLTILNVNDLSLFLYKLDF